METSLVDFPLELLHAICVDLSLKDIRSITQLSIEYNKIIAPIFNKAVYTVASKNFVHRKGMSYIQRNSFFIKYQHNKYRNTQSSPDEIFYIRDDEYILYFI